MATIEERLQEHILEHYTSVNQFCRESGIASSTIFTILKRGLNTTTTTTILRICKALGLDADALYNGRIEYATKQEAPSETIDILKYIRELEFLNATYHGKPLTDEQKQLIITTAEIAIQTAIKKY